MKDELITNKLDNLIEDYRRIKEIERESLFSSHTISRIRKFEVESNTFTLLKCVFLIFIVFFVHNSFSFIFGTGDSLVDAEKYDNFRSVFVRIACTINIRKRVMYVRKIR